MGPSEAGKTARIIAIANQKGGVGKTTTAINLGAALAELGKKVLIVDLDPQGNASTGLGIDDRGHTTYDVLLEETPVDVVIQATNVDGLSIIPATTDLSSADLELANSKHRSTALKRALRKKPMRKQGFDFILIDCPPSLSLLTVNAMVAAHSVLVPLQSEFYALEGLSQLMLTVREVRASANPELRIEGVVMTMSDHRNNLSRQVEADARETLGEVVFETVVPRNVRLSEAPSYALPVMEFDSQSKGSKAYRALAQEMVERKSAPAI